MAGKPQKRKAVSKLKTATTKTVRTVKRRTATKPKKTSVPRTKAKPKTTTKPGTKTKPRKPTATRTAPKPRKAAKPRKGTKPQKSSATRATATPKKTGSKGTTRVSKTARRTPPVARKSATFILDAPSGWDVAIAGSFNNWQPQAMAKGPDSLWRITLELAPGTYEYKFLVDTEWREDPGNPRKTINESGGFNSICEVT